MKITDLVPRTVLEALVPIGVALEHLYDDLERAGYDEVDEIVEYFVDGIASTPHMALAIEFAFIYIGQKRFSTTVSAAQFYGACVYQMDTIVNRQNRTLKFDAIAKARPHHIKLGLQALTGTPIQMDVLLGKVLGSGEYKFVRGTVLASEDERHFPIGIKPYDDSWWFTYDKATGYLMRVGISDMAEARTLLANTLSLEHSTSPLGLEVWCAIMGDHTPPDDLGKLKATASTMWEPEPKPDYANDMPLWLRYTEGEHETPPKLRVTGTRLFSQKLLNERAQTPQVVELPDLRYVYEDGMNQRKKVDLRRTMVNRVVEQGIQDSLAISPLETALQARFPLWVLMSDRREIEQSKAEAVLNVSVASDIGSELASLRTIVEQQMRIALGAEGAKVSAKSKSTALARAVQAARAIMTLRKEAGYFEMNTANKSGLFKNSDSTVLQDDGAQFEKLLEQLAQGGDLDE
ncbi:hypothetical protein ACRXCV_00090 (plasmid) [Halobacteriovorax sp. GFR7]|uniref:hypothetical protein n=1 Tax=unclassified Halobacteriovorax TaxID=2639665 RepID=UPI003D985175